MYSCQYRLCSFRKYYYHYYYYCYFDTLILLCSSTYASCLMVLNIGISSMHLHTQIMVMFLTKIFLSWQHILNTWKYLSPTIFYFHNCNFALWFLIHIESVTTITTFKKKRKKRRSNGRREIDFLREYKCLAKVRAVSVSSLQS